VLVDTDILLDVALDRQPHADASARLLDALEVRPGAGYVAWHSLANFFYMVAPTRSRGDARRFLEELLGFLEVAPATTEGAQQAARMPMPDFEDALQVAAALACGAAVIATRNLRDFRRSPVPAADPIEVVSALEGGA
jgi:predicted nucleic acid-binding protein